MGIRIDYDVEQDVDVTARFEIYDEEPDSIRAEYPSDILELMESSNISMADVITEAIGCGVPLPESHSLTIDLVLAFIDSDSLDSLELKRLINAAVMLMVNAVDRAERANKTLREEVDRLIVSGAPDQKTA